MTGICEGRRHRHRRRPGHRAGHALELARQGAHVVVNDLGGSGRGAGRTLAPPRPWSMRSRPPAASPWANTDDVAHWSGATGWSSRRWRSSAGWTFWSTTRGSFGTRMLFNSEQEWDAVKESESTSRARSPPCAGPPPTWRPPGQGR